MFTGIVEGLGEIAKVSSQGQGRRLRVRSDLPSEEIKLGDSVAVSGTCLTVVKIGPNWFEADVAPETLSKTVIGELKPGDPVNLERALRLSDRLDGHLVSGHVDGTGLISEKKPYANAIVISIQIPATLSDHIIKKGSVAIDGVSLTINEITGNQIELSIVPHTAKLTTIGIKNPGDKVNIETDMIGKYVERFVKNQLNPQSKDQENSGSSDISIAFLAKKGFL
jgi:riboflavin synthase